MASKRRVPSVSLVVCRHDNVFTSCSVPCLTVLNRGSQTPTLEQTADPNSWNGALEALSTFGPPKSPIDLLHFWRRKRRLRLRLPVRPRQLDQPSPMIRLVAACVILCRSYGYPTSRTYFQFAGRKISTDGRKGCELPDCPTDARYDYCEERNRQAANAS
jgi:hypothetical protein